MGFDSVLILIVIELKVKKMVVREFELVLKQGRMSFPPPIGKAVYIHNSIIILCSVSIFVASLSVIERFYETISEKSLNGHSDYLRCSPQTRC